MELAKIKAGISRIDPVAGMENWENQEFKGSHPTQLVLFKVQNDLIPKNISDQNFTIDGKQFKIRESSRCTRGGGGGGGESEWPSALQTHYSI